MPGFISVAPGQPIRSTHVNQFSQWITGGRKDVSGAIITTHATEYTVTATNEDTSAGNVLKLISGASTIALFNKTGATLSVPLISTSPLASALASGQTAGDTFYASSASSFSRVAKGNAFEAWIMSAGATAPNWAASLQSLLASAGSLVVASAANTPAHLPKGTGLQELVMNAGATGQTWATGVLAVATTAGDTFFGTGLNAVTRVAAGTAWQNWAMNAAATGATWVSCAVALAVTQGDLFYATGANSLVRLARGSNGQVLTLASGLPVWTAPVTAAALLIASTTLVATSATIDFTSVSQSFRHLEIYCSTFNATGGSNISVQFSATGTTFDTTASYDYCYTLTQHTAVSGTATMGQSSGLAAGHGGTGANVLTPLRMTIEDYSGTDKQKSYQAWGGRKDGTAVADMSKIDLVGYWRSTTAVMGVRFLTGGVFGIGSRISIYGVPAS